MRSSFAVCPGKYVNEQACYQRMLKLWRDMWRTGHMTDVNWFWKQRKSIVIQNSVICSASIVSGETRVGLFVFVLWTPHVVLLKRSRSSFYFLGTGKLLNLYCTLTCCITLNQFSEFALWYHDLSLLWSCAPALSISCSNEIFHSTVIWEKKFALKVGFNTSH